MTFCNSLQICWVLEQSNFRIWDQIVIQRVSVYVFMSSNGPNLNVRHVVSVPPNFQLHVSDRIPVHVHTASRCSLKAARVAKGNLKLDFLQGPPQSGRVMQSQQPCTSHEPESLCLPLWKAYSISSIRHTWNVALHTLCFIFSPSMSYQDARIPAASG